MTGDRRHPFDLTDEVALVTGCGSIGPGWGNGKAIAVLLAQQGAAVFGADLSIEAAEEMRDLIASQGGNVRLAAADVTDAAQVAQLVTECHAAFGGIDILVNNVGRSEPDGPAEIDPATWDGQLSVNLTSAYLMCRQVLPIMERQGRGSIVNIASVAGLRYIGEHRIRRCVAQSTRLCRGLCLFRRDVGKQPAQLLVADDHRTLGRGGSVARRSAVSRALRHRRARHARRLPAFRSSARAALAFQRRADCRCNRRRRPGGVGVELDALPRLPAILGCGYLSATALFWTIPPVLLTGPGAAGGITLIGSIAQTGAVTAPLVLGYARDSSGSMAIGLVAVARVLVAGTAALMLGIPRQLFVRAPVRT